MSVITKKILLSVIFIVHLIIPVLSNLLPSRPHVLAPLYFYGDLLFLTKKWVYFPGSTDAEYIFYFVGTGKDGKSEVFPETMREKNWFIYNFVNGNHLDHYFYLSRNSDRRDDYMSFLCRENPSLVHVQNKLTILPLLKRESAGKSGNHYSTVKKEMVLAKRDCP